VADLVDIEEVRAHLNLGDDTSHDDELYLYIEAVTAHAERRYGSVIDDPPADLRLAALEDIRGLYQPGQIGPLADFGAFGTQTAEATEIGPGYRPVRLWPRVDAWLDWSLRSSRSPTYSFPDAVAWPDPVEYQAP